MKQEPNNEMDLMLRNLGRAANSAPANSGNGTAGFPIDEHPDADELNAYAENAIPAAARVRYTEHLADCTRCRQMVSQLSLAAGLIVEKKSEAVPWPSGIKAFLSSLFSPMVLRYAVPAVALIAVASIGLMVFRQRAGNDAAHIQANSQVAQTQTEPASPGLTANYLYDDEQPKSNAPHS